MCLAGYIMERSEALRLTEEWNAVLNWPKLPRPLNYFRMSECAPDPGNGEFAGVAKQLRIEVGRGLEGRPTFSRCSPVRMRRLGSP